VVRVPEGADWIIKQVLDLGAQTILVPMVNSADQARAVVQACRYPPQGRRGMGAAVARASQFGGLGDYTTNANDEICILVQAETKTAMQNLPHILRVDGVDGVFIGPADLGADMGLRDDLAADDLWAEVTRGLRMIRAAGKAAGVIVGTPDMQAKMTDAGANFLGVGADSLVLSQGLRDLAAQQG
jgi:4-hydroxy-2-oxoheptanedioate aldolase